jgi:hypothetical protein
VRVAFAGGGGCVGDSVARRFDVIICYQIVEACLDVIRKVRDRAVRVVHASVFLTGQAAAPGLYPQLDTEHSSLGTWIMGVPLQNLILKMCGTAYKLQT